MTADTTDRAAALAAIRALWLKTNGSPWEPPNPNDKRVTALIAGGWLRRVDGRCGFEAMKDSMLAFTDAARALIAAEAEVTRLTAELRKFAVHGIPRIDHNPTRLMARDNADAMKVEEFWQDYFAQANENVKDEAKRALGEG